MLTTALFAALALFQVPQTPQTVPPPDAVVATVNGKPVTAAELAPYLWSWQARPAIQEMAQSRAIAEEAAKRGLTVTDAELQARVGTQFAGIQKTLPAGQTVDDFLDSRRLTRAHVEALTRTAILLDKIAESEFKPADFVKLDGLLFQAPVQSAPDVQAKAQKSADAAYASLASGKPWDVVYKANTLAPNPLAIGASSPWTSVDRFPEAMRAQIAALKPQGTTKPMATPVGVQIFHLAARGTEAPAAELASLKAQYVQGARAAVLQRLHDATKVEIK